MKTIKHIAASLVLVWGFTACQQNYKIEGIAEGFSPGDTLLITTDLDSLRPQAEVIIDKEGCFTYGEHSDTIIIHQLYAKADPEVCCYYFSEPGTISLTLRTEGRSRVGGTSLNDEWQQLDDICYDYEQKLEALVARFYDEHMTEDELNQTSEQIKLLDQEKQRWVQDFTQRNVENAIGLFLQK